VPGLLFVLFLWALAIVDSRNAFQWHEKATRRLDQDAGVVIDNEVQH
jgi:hypothetical protein